MLKIVKESLNEIISFERGRDPLFSLGIDKRKLIENWLDEMEIENYEINEDYMINVEEGIILSKRNLIKFPDYIQFDKVWGLFTCSRNNLISLRGSPNKVFDDFYCSNNQLSSLEGCPKFVNGEFGCTGNKIKFTVEDVIKLCDVRKHIRV